MTRIRAPAGVRNIGDDGNDYFVLALVHDLMGWPSSFVSVIYLFDCFTEFMHRWQTRCRKLELASGEFWSTFDLPLASNSEMRKPCFPRE